MFQVTWIIIYSGLHHQWHWLTSVRRSDDVTENIAVFLLRKGNEMEISVEIL